MKFTVKTLMMVLAMASLVSCASSDGFEDLFNGKNFDGFEQLNGKAKYVVEDGMMVGISTVNTPNSFMATKKTYKDFILEFDVLCDKGLNSGVQFRSQSLPEYDNGRVHGYQCEIETSPRKWSGGIFDEARRGWLCPLGNNPKGQEAYKLGEWNHYRIEALGPVMRIWVNGVNTSNLYDDMTPEGFIAFQVHAIGGDKQLEGLKIRWKNIRIMTENVKENMMKGELTPVVNKIPNTLSEEEVAQGWKLLFDGKTSNGWKGATSDTFPTVGWKIKDGILSIGESGGKESVHAGDIVTVDKYSAFILKVEFKLSAGANSGIKYFVGDNNVPGRSAFGLEYQLLDDKLHPDAKLCTTYEGSRTLASLYDMIPAKNKNLVRPRVDNWYIAEIRVYPNNHIEHWLNNVKMLEYDRFTPEFKELIKNSKYSRPGFNKGATPFGESKDGHILLQDHGNYVQFRSIKILDLTK